MSRDRVERALADFSSYLRGEPSNWRETVRNLTAEERDQVNGLLIAEGEVDGQLSDETVESALREWERRGGWFWCALADP